MAADGRGLQQVHINENFAKLAEALYIADRKAREAVEMRAQLEKKLAQKEKEKKEEHLRQLAQKAREERAGIRPIGHGNPPYNLIRYKPIFWKKPHVCSVFMYYLQIHMCVLFKHTILHFLFFLFV